MSRWCISSVQRIWRKHGLQPPLSHPLRQLHYSRRSSSYPDTLRARPLFLRLRCAGQEGCDRTVSSFIGAAKGFGAVTFQRRSTLPSNSSRRSAVHISYRASATESRPRASTAHLDLLLDRLSASTVVINRPPELPPRLRDRAPHQLRVWARGSTRDPRALRPKSCAAPPSRHSSENQFRSPPIVGENPRASHINE